MTAEAKPRSVPRPQWSPLPRAGCVNVQAKVLYKQADLVLAMLDFAPNATIDEHSADFDIEVVCLKGSGFVSVGTEVSELKVDQTVSWPKGTMHRLWTTTAAMTTLMVEKT